MTKLTAQQKTFLDEQVKAAYRAQFYSEAIEHASPDELRAVLTPYTDGCASQADFEMFLRYNPSASTPEHPLTYEIYLDYLAQIAQATRVDLFHHSCRRFAETFQGTSSIQNGPGNAESPSLIEVLGDTWERAAENPSYDDEERNTVLNGIEHNLEHPSEFRTITCGETKFTVNPKQGDSLDCADHASTQRILDDLTGPKK
jgi:hypothetical protein